ncbi:MAG: MogA/MoaB family molybdenum cofactor biosynthesis protein [Candidatus Omnitrophota bacterium]
MAAKTRHLQNVRVVLLTISDACAAGFRSDETGKVLASLLKKSGALVIKKEILPDDVYLIKTRLKTVCDCGEADVVLSCGGTGLGPRDVTPEATKSVVEKEVIGLAEEIRRQGVKHTKYAALSRAVCGLRANTLIINLPGNPKGARQSFEAIMDLIPHALAMMRGEGH